MRFGLQCKHGFTALTSVCPVMLRLQIIAAPFGNHKLMLQRALTGDSATIIGFGEFDLNHAQYPITVAR
jgi:hypothetical protein